MSWAATPSRSCVTAIRASIRELAGDRARCGSAHGVDGPMAPSATRWAAASKAGADQPPPLSMQPYLAQSSGFRLSPSLSRLVGAGT